MLGDQLSGLEWRDLLAEVIRTYAPSACLVHVAVGLRDEAAGPFWKHE